MTFRCERCHRVFADDEAEEKGQICWQRCGGKLVPVPEVGADADALLHLPFPVAYPLAFARSLERPDAERLENTFFAASQAMRVTALVLLADYFEVGTSSPRLQAAIRGLRFPHWQEWSVLCDQLCHFWSGDFRGQEPERPCRFPALVQGWREVNGLDGPSAAWAQALEGLPGLRGVASSPNEALWKARNDRAHRTATQVGDPARDREALARLLPLVEREVAALFPPGALTLVRALDRDPLRVIRLAGPHVDLAFQPEAPDPVAAVLLERADVVAIQGPAGVPVHPLIACTERGVEGFPSTEQVALLEGSNPHRVTLLGVRSYHERPDLVKPFLEALAGKDLEFGLDRGDTRPWTLPDWAAFDSREAVGALKDRKYFPDCYLERSGVDDALAEGLEAGGKAILVLGEAGSGKSSLLARLTERLLDAQAVPGSSDKRPDGNTVIFLSGRAAFAGDAGKPGPQLLCDAVLGRAGVRAGAFRSLTDFARWMGAQAREDTLQGRRVYLILDALNEAERFVDLLKALDAFLPCLGQHPWLRLVVSIRSGAWESLRRRNADQALDGALLEHEACLRVFPAPGREEGLPFLRVRAFQGDREGRAAYARRQQALPGRASRIPYDLLHPRIRTLLLSPLHLHLFHETFRDQEAGPPELDEPQLFSAYLASLCKENASLGESLARIGRLMFEERRPVLPADRADAWIHEWRERLGYQSAICVAKLDPLEELVAHSVLLRPAEEGLGSERRLVAFQFGHQRLCEQVLVQHLRTLISPRVLPSGEEVLAWTKRAAEAPAFPELAGAVGILAGERVARGEGADLAPLLGVLDHATCTQVLGAALRALGPVWGPEEEGRPEATALVEALEGWLADRRHLLDSVRLEYASSAACKWLEESGFTFAALGLVRARVRIIRGLVGLKPTSTTFLGYLPQVLDLAVPLERKAGHGEVADAHLEEICTLVRTLAQAEPGNGKRQRALARALEDLGQAAERRKDPGTAEGLYEEAFRIKQALQGDDEPNYHRFGLAKSHLLRGISCAQGERDVEAVDAYREALAGFRSLDEEHPGRPAFQRALFGALHGLGKSLLRTGARTEGWPLIKEAGGIIRSLVRTAPGRTGYRLDLAWYLCDVASLALGAAKRAERRDPADAQGKAAHWKAQAAAVLEEGTGILEDLVRAEPGRLDLRESLARAQRVRARLEGAGPGA